MRIGALSVALVAINLALAFAGTGVAPKFGLDEVSGVVRQGNALLMVGDDQPGKYFKYTLPQNARFGTKDQRFLEIKIQSHRVSHLRLDRGNLALDLESIDLLADGRVVVLSERLHSLIGDSGIIAEYPNALSEFGNRGLEGLAVRRLDDGSSRVAVLWEGGHLQNNDLPVELRGDLKWKATKPVVFVHDIKQNNCVGRVQAELRPLEIPLPKKNLQTKHRFRAPDLVWYKWTKDDWGFIVLLSGIDPGLPVAKGRYKYRRLQRFKADGKSFVPVDGIIDLESVLPLRYKNANWEGLAWYDEGKSVVLIYDGFPRGDLTVVVVKVGAESWK